MGPGLLRVGGGRGQIIACCVKPLSIPAMAGRQEGVFAKVGKAHHVKIRLQVSFEDFIVRNAQWEV